MIFELFIVEYVSWTFWTVFYFLFMRIVFHAILICMIIYVFRVRLIAPHSQNFNASFTIKNKLTTDNLFSYNI